MLQTTLLNQVMHEALNKAIEAAGGESRLVQLMRLHLPANSRFDRGHVYYWRTRSKCGVPAEYCRAVSLAVAGAVSESELRPDLFVSATTPAPIGTTSGMTDGS